MKTVSMSCGETVSGVSRVWGLSYPMEHSDGGRSLSKRPKQKNDCTVRAAALSFGLDYDFVYDLFARNGRKCTRGFDIMKWLNGFHSLGFVPVGGRSVRVRKIAFPAIKGESRMNPATFCEQYSEGRYICRVAKHCFAVIDGVVYDTFENAPNRCIYTAWCIEL